jgi:predicted DNA-binding transcriptional regulator YafY
MKSKAEAVWQPSKSDKSERLLQLTCALLFSERGLTKSQLFRAIPAYYEAINSGTTDDSLNRMFERDKSDLRSTGIQVFTANPSAEAEEIRYVIAEDTFEWPQHTQLSAKHLQLLELAAQVWSQASLESDANQALVRLKALGIEPAAADLIGFAPRIETLEPCFNPLSIAADESLEVSFSYRKPTGEISVRHVEPWSLHNIDGQWLLQCFDLGAREVRNFLLKRIVSKVTFTKDGDSERSFAKPDIQKMKLAEKELQEHIKNQICELKVKPDSQAWFHFRLDDSDAVKNETVSFNFMDINLLAEELRDFALDIEIIKPKTLDELIRAGFERVVAEHA